MSSNIGRFTWYDLNTTDVAAGLDFYTAVIGWTLTPFDENYQMFTADAPIGGAMPLSADAKAMGAPSNWLGYVQVSNVDTCATRTTELGGKIYAPAFDMPNVGRVCIVADPQGAVFGLFQPDDASGEYDAVAKPGTVIWRELMTSDVDAAHAFYGALLGWSVADTMDMGPTGTYAMMAPAKGQKAAHGVMKAPAEMPGSAWTYYVHVDDLDATIERTKANGGSVMNGPMEIPGGMRVANCVDPQGAMFSIHGK
ncbi:MAG: putative enzyme related to lactoylglutathione lyase [Bradymonadia bacterium]|jgi:predicted enzyme related to lactoylglutathione lyase